MDVRSPGSDSTHPGRLGARDLALAAMVNIAWGLNIIAIKETVELVPVSLAGALRMGIVALVLLPWLRLVPGRMIELVGVGLVSGALFMIVINASLKMATNVSALAVTSQLGAPFSLILGIIFLREEVHWPRIAGCAMALAGVVVIGFDPAMFDEIPAILLSVFAALLWAFGTLVLRGLRGVPVLTIYAWIGLVATPTLLAVAWFTEPDTAGALRTVPLAALGWLAFSAIGSTVVGQGGMASLLQRHPVSLVVPLTLASPLIAVVASGFFYDIDVTVPMVIGGLMTLGGVAVITIRGARKARA
jgi:O-acetylserine/cysteine efflux transporter